MKNKGESKGEEQQVENVAKRPDTRQSEAGLSYAEEEDFKSDDNSMLSFTQRRNVKNPLWFATRSI